MEIAAATVRLESCRFSLGVWISDHGKEPENDHHGFTTTAQLPGRGPPLAAAYRFSTHLNCGPATQRELLF